MTDFRQSREWIALTNQAIKTFGPICELCGRREGESGAVIGIVHRIPANQRPDLALSLANVRVACFDCGYGNPIYPGALGFWAGKPWYTPEEFLERIQTARRDRGAA